MILETEWVLRYAYDFSAEDICGAFINLSGLKNIHLSNPKFISQAIEWHWQGMDFSDALHIIQGQQYEKLYTFDKSLTMLFRHFFNSDIKQLLLIKLPSQTPRLQYLNQTKAFRCHLNAP